MVRMLQSLDNGHKNRVVFDLQHFADTEAVAAPAAAEQSVPASDAPLPSSFEEAGNMYLKALESPTGTTVAQETEAQDTATTPEATQPASQTQPEADVPQQPKDVLELFKARGVTKFKDPEKLVDSVLAQEKWNTRLSQENAELKRKMTELQTTSPAAPASATKTPQDGAAAVPEKMDPDAFISQLYEDPMAALAPLKEQWRQEFMNELAPSLQGMQDVMAAGKAAKTENAQREAAQVFFAEHSDAPEFIEQMTDILAQDASFAQLDDPVAIKDLLEKTFTYVRGMSYKAPAAPEELIANLLGDEKMFQQYIANNPDIKRKLLSSAVTEMQNTKAPPMVSSPGGVTMTPKPADAPESFEALGDRIKRSLGFS